MKYHIFTATLIGTAALWGMEPEVKQSIKPQGRLAHINFDDKEKAFELLTQNKASLLKTLLAEEQRGIYCPDLHVAKHFLHTVLFPTPTGDDIVSSDIKRPYEALDSTTQEFVSCITSKDAYYRNFIHGLHRYDDTKKFLEIIGRTPIQNHPHYVINSYVVNSYGSHPSTYPGRKLPLLHYTLAQINDGIFTKTIGKTICKFLLLHRANVNAHDDAGNTPLHHAPTPGFVTLFCLHGANPSEVGKLGQTPLLNHIRLQSWSIVKKLLPYCCADAINKSDEEGNTPLEEAVKQGNKEIIQLLLGNGADWTLCHGFGDTLDDETTNPEIRSFMIDHIEKSIRLFLRDDNHEAMKRIMHSGIFSVIDFDELAQWTLANFSNTTNADSNFNTRASATNNAAGYVLSVCDVRGMRLAGHKGILLPF